MWIREGLRSAIFAPIQAYERAVGAYHVDHPQMGFFNEEDALVARDIMAGALTVAERLKRLQSIVRLETSGIASVAGMPLLDVERSTEPPVG